MTEPDLGRHEEEIVRTPPPAVVFLVLLAGCGPPGDPAPGDPATGGLAPTARPLPPWTWELPTCPAYRESDYAAPDHRISVEMAADGTVTEVYEAGWAERALAETQAVVRTCGEYEPATGEYLEQHQVVATGFAPADESLLVRTVRLTPHQPVRTWYTTVTRQGETVTTVPDQLCPPVADATCAAPQA